MSFTFRHAISKINLKLNELGVASLTISEAKEMGVVDDMTQAGIDDVIRQACEIREAFRIK